MSEKPQVRTLIENPNRFNEISSQYDNDVDCYENLLRQAKRSLETFEEYAEFHSICLEHGPTSYVKEQLEANAVRSLKNMVLQTSTAGKRFPIHTAAQFRHRVELYRDLGIESVTQRSAAFTLLEYIFDAVEDQARDKDEGYGYKVLSRLLCEQPTPAGDLTAILVRARFVVGALTAGRQMSLDTFAGEMIANLPDPKKDDGATASEQLQRSQERNYEDSEKVELAASALSRGGGEEILEEYLYLSAREVPEQYRHGGDNPWRGELQLAVHQWECILNTFSETYSSERRARSRSYYHIVQGELSSGGQWRSQRDERSLPDVNFLRATNHYVNAAVEIREIDPARYIKYLSKSFRHQATAAHYREWGPCRGWLATQKIHEQAIEIVINAVDEFDETERLNETLSETVARHNFREHRAAAVVAFEQRDIDGISNEIEEAQSYIDILDSPRRGLIDSLEDLAEALLFEETGEYAEAIKKYQTTSHPKLDVEKRTHLVEVKRAINNGQYATAKDTAESEFGETPIYTAVVVATGESLSSRPAIKPPVLSGVSAIDEESKWLLTYLVYLLSAADTDIGSTTIEQILYEL